MKKIYMNEKARFFEMRGIPIVANVDNSAIIGLTPEGVDFWKKIQQQVVTTEDVDVHQELYQQLIESDIISETVYAPCEVVEFSPTFAYLHVTNKCNLKCLGCYSMDDRSRCCQKEPTLDELKLAMERLKAAGVETVVISGGEPFVRRDFKELLTYGKALGLYLIVITNGTISVDFEPYLDVIDEISVSVDGFSLEQPTFIRDAGIFEKIMTTVKKLKALDFNVGILPTLHRKNIRYMREYDELSNELGVRISYSLLSVCETSELGSFIPNNEDLRQLSDYIFTAGAAVEDMSLSRNLGASLSCGAGKDLISISSDGNIYPCHLLHMPELALGNIFQHALEVEKLNQDVLDEFCTKNVETIDGCKKCEFRYFCAGGCRARAYYDHGTINKRDRYCAHMKHFYQNVTDELLNELES